MNEFSKYTEIIENLFDPILNEYKDKEVTELMINPGGYVFVEKAGIIKELGKVLDEHAISAALKVLAKTAGNEAVANHASSIVRISIGDMRISGALSPVSPDGSFLTIRKHKDKEDRPTLNDLIHKFKALSQEQADKIIDLVIDKKQNCIVAGPTGSGKTTIANALLSKIPPHERIVTIESSRELAVDLNNYVALVPNLTHNITARTLVQLAMELYPGRLIVGETKGEETYDLIRAFNSGHDGSISTAHSSSALGALDALEMLFMMSLPTGASVPVEVARRYIAKNVNLVVYCGRSYQSIDGVLRTVRRVEEICIVKGVGNDGSYILEAV